jgi:hypothetical protein
MRHRDESHVEAAYCKGASEHDNRRLDDDCGSPKWSGQVKAQALQSFKADGTRTQSGHSRRQPTGAEARQDEQHEHAA